MTVWRRERDYFGLKDYEKGGGQCHSYIRVWGGGGEDNIIYYIEVILKDQGLLPNEKT